MPALPDASPTVELLWTGGAWLEGPVWLPAEEGVRFSDIPNDRILHFDAATGEVHVHREGAEFVNGRTLDREGRILQCSHGRRAVERESDGVVEVVVDRWGGGRFHSPNDVVVADDGAIWFTDPPYGLHPSGREGYPGSPEYEGCFVFRHDTATGETVAVITDMVHPNGLAFSPDGSLLYVADTGVVWDAAGPRHIKVYDTATAQGRVFVEPTGVADGLRVDGAGRVWTSSGAAVEVFATTGERLARVEVPETVSNLCFAGSDLYLTASTSLYRLRLGWSDHSRSGPSAGGISQPSSMS